MNNVTKLNKSNVKARVALILSKSPTTAALRTTLAQCEAKIKAVASKEMEYSADAYWWQLGELNRQRMAIIVAIKTLAIR